MRVALYKWLCMVLSTMLFVSTAFAYTRVVFDGEREPLSQLRQQILGDLGESGKKFSLDLVGVWPKGVEVSPGAYLVKLRRSDSGDAMERIDVDLFALGQSGEGRSSPVCSLRFVARQLTQVLVAKVHVAEGAPLACDERFAEEYRPVQRGRFPWSRGCAALSGLESRRPMMPGDVLLVADARRPPLIRDRAMVEATVRMRGVELRVTAQALQNAMLGERLWIKPIGSSMTIRARATGVGNVMVD